MGAMILAEIGDFSRFDSPDKILAYAGTVTIYLSIRAVGYTVIPIWKSGVRVTCDMPFINATKYVCHWDESFGAYLAKKRALKGKHYNVAIIPCHKETGTNHLCNGKIGSGITPMLRNSFLKVSV